MTFYTTILFLPIDYFPTIKTRLNNQYKEGTVQPESSESGELMVLAKGKFECYAFKLKPVPLRLFHNPTVSGLSQGSFESRHGVGNSTGGHAFRCQGKIHTDWTSPQSFKKL